jgi:hypothetical protein
MNKKFIYLLTIFILIGSLFGCTIFNDIVPDNNSNDIVSNDNLTIVDEVTTSILEDGYYSTPKDVAEYLFVYGKLPDNYIKKNDASSKGWNSSEGNLWDVTDKMIIGGDNFGNREGLLPKADGRKYFECDINYSGGYRGAERIVFSNDGLIFYEICNT